MPIGPGKYDEVLAEALEKVGAKQGILMILDGDKGSGLSVKVAVALINTVPSILESIAVDIRRNGL